MVIAIAQSGNHPILCAIALIIKAISTRSLPIFSKINFQAIALQNQRCT
ncbi:MAG: hypothetical protein ACSI46_03420 [Gloeotrichia echinulata DVL01]|nr:hypothetical protein [Gloeotrichia echinulata DEX184]